MKIKHCKMLSVSAAILLCLFQPLAAQEAEELQEEATEQLNLSWRVLDKSDWNGSVYTVKAEDFLNSATTFMTEDLMGIVPGLFMRQSEGGLENGNASYWIRGNRTSSNGVLVLVDGQERAFATLTPEEIETISVLKDAAAVGIYGMRAANGAILITTKQGSEGTPKVSFSGQLIGQEPTSLLSPMDAYGYAKHYNAALRSDEATPLYSEFDLANYAAGGDGLDYADVHWLEKYYKKSWLLQRYNLTVSGGLKNAKYFVDFGYLHQPGMLNTAGDLGYNTNNNADRFNYRSNISVEVTKTTHLDVSLYGWFKNENMPYTSASNVFDLLNTTPALSFPEYYIYRDTMIDTDGNQITPLGGKILTGNTYNTNPWAIMNRRGYSRAMQMYGSMSAVLTQRLDAITKGLYAAASIAMDSQTSSTIQRVRSAAYYTPQGGDVYKKTGNDGTLSNTVESKSGRRFLTINGRIGYDRSFGKNNISAAAFYEQFENTTDTGVPARLQYTSAFASWNYDHRFGIDLTGSYMGWYGFAPGHKFGFFPTVSAGWTLSNEEFLKGSKTINYLKVRASYGELGSYRGVDQFTYMGYMTASSGVYINGNQMANSRNGYHEGQIANDNLRWEKARQTNIGLDLTAFGGRLSFTGDYFMDDRSDVYMTNNKVSTIIGMSSSVTVNSNIGALTSRGFEMAANWKDHIGDFKYNFGGTWSFSRSILLADGSAGEEYDYVAAVGQLYGRKLGYEVEGIFQSYEEIAAHATQSWAAVKPGDFKYRDVNGDGIINADDRVPLGYGNVPEIFYGFNFGFAWKGLSLNVLFQGAAHVHHNMTNQILVPFISYGNIYEHQLDYWTPENPGAKFPRTGIAATSYANNTQNNTLDMEPADYLRLKRVELAYTWDWGQKSFVKGLTTFVSGYNLLTFTKYQYGDPEYSASTANLPITRNVSIGCRVNF
ncbi:MAG: SusC/RagA family TonB-linked outer membrane protein [Bacteroidales bacterium]|nr:SusC/RagA family TonB-linked outer membrane protein [Bacteroidales bacterium]